MKPWQRLTVHRLRVGWLNNGRGTARADDAQGTPTQSQISPSIIEYEYYYQHRHLSPTVFQLFSWSTDAKAALSGRATMSNLSLNRFQHSLLYLTHPHLTTDSITLSCMRQKPHYQVEPQSRVTLVQRCVAQFSVFRKQLDFSMISSLFVCFFFFITLKPRVG